MDTAWLFQALFHLAAELYPRVSSQDLFCTIIASIHQQHWNTLRNALVSVSGGRAGASPEFILDVY
jgi:hypothetical protein